jgi:hypothetical protein
LRARKKSGDLTTAIVPAGTSFPAVLREPFDLVIARCAATSFLDQLNSVRSIHMRCRMTASSRDGDCIVEPGPPMVSRLTYRFQPKAELQDNPASLGDYEYILFGGDNPENMLRPSIRRMLPLDVMAALRDAEKDLATWRRSPLRPLIEALAGTLDDKACAQIQGQVDAAQSDLAHRQEVQTIAETISHGDCKSYSIAKYAAARVAGISADHVRLVVVHDRRHSFDHMVAAVYQNGEWLILDNLTNLLVRDSEKKDYEPLAILDYRGVRRYSSAFSFN